MLAGLVAVTGSALLCAAALYDLGWRLVPNRLPLALAGAGLVLRAGEGLDALLASLVGALVVAALLGAAWWRGLLGGGDAKLGVAAGLFVPPQALAAFVLATALAGGVLALLFLALRPLLPARIAPAGRAAPLLRRLARAEAFRIRRGVLPYAVAIAAGAILAGPFASIAAGAAPA